HARFGRRPWASLFDAAIHYARDGFGATRAYGRFAGEQQAVLAADRRSARTFLSDGAPPGLGGPIVQPDLARTLERLAAEGAESFHRGHLAKALAEACREAGALVTAEDLAAEIDRRRAAPPRAPARAAASGDTTYFCVVDGEGNAVSGIQSLNSAFGSGVMAGDTGILLNNRMAYWHLEPGHPNRLAPGKR